VLQWIQSSGVGVVVPSLTALPVDLCERVRRCGMSVAHHAANNRAVFEVASLVQSLLPSHPRQQQQTLVAPPHALPLHSEQPSKGVYDSRSVIACQPGCRPSSQAASALASSQASGQAAAPLAERAPSPPSREARASPPSSSSSRAMHEHAT